MLFNIKELQEKKEQESLPVWVQYMKTVVCFKPIRGHTYHGVQVDKEKKTLEQWFSNLGLCPLGRPTDSAKRVA